MWAKLFVLAACISVTFAPTYTMITPGVTEAHLYGDQETVSDPAAFVCPTGALTYEFDGVPSRYNPDMAQAACEACYGVPCFNRDYVDYTGDGYGPADYGDWIFGYQDYLSGYDESYSTGAAGRVFLQGDSFSWAFFWYDGITVSIDNIPSIAVGACQPVYVRNEVGQSLDILPSTLANDATCSFFTDAACTQVFTEQVTDQPFLFFAQCTRAAFQQIQVTSTLTSNAFQVIDTSATGGQICGDPHFVGFDGTKFLFDGEVGSYYNLFSNQYVSINTLIADAENANPYVKSTVNGAVSIRTAAFNMSVNSAAFNKATNTLTYEFNGEMMTIKEKQTVRLNDNCILLNLERDSAKARHHHHTFTVSNAHFSVSIYVSEDHNIYINNTYFDYYISADLSDATVLGGILGKTAGKYNALNDIESKQASFLVDSIYGVGQDGKFLGKALCQKAKRIDCNVLPNGHSCTSNANCGSGACDKNGVCIPVGGCLVDADCTSIAAGDTCDKGLCTAPGSCTQDSDCGNFQTCQDGTCSGDVKRSDAKNAKSDEPCPEKSTLVRCGQAPPPSPKN